ncbi:hypothetical protein [Nitratireductor indicus]|nr:hypothetical protein [Nitratireductor indicus]MDS1138236.1 hypothetical protein [Nitratireductor indicus]SFQ64418.1 hypothetical protein SAMN05216176_108133 [Nitratireductor indicus]
MQEHDIIETFPAPLKAGAPEAAACLVAEDAAFACVRATPDASEKTS